MATTIQLSVTGKVTGRNGIAIPGVTVKAFWDSATPQTAGVLGSTTADAWGRYKLTYRYQTEKQMDSFSDTVPVALMVEAGEKQITVGRVSFKQTTLEAVQDIVLDYMHYTNVLTKPQLGVARTLAGKSCGEFKRMMLTPAQKEVVACVQNLAGMKQDGVCNEATYKALKAVIFHTNLVFDKKKKAKLYGMLQELGCNVPAEVAAMNIINASTLQPINDLRRRRQLELTNLIDEPAWTILEEELLAKRMKGRNTRAEIQKKVRRAAGFVLKEEAATEEKLGEKLTRQKITAGKETISRLQTKLGLEPTGDLDLQTYKKIESVSMSHGRGTSYLAAPDARDLVVTNCRMSLNVRDEVEVPRLQQGLAYLGYKIDQEEVDTCTFGKSTMAAVKGFQEANHIPVTSKYDAKTITTLSSQLLEVNPGATRLHYSHVVKGTVRDEKWVGKKDMVVKVFIQEFDGTEKLVCTRTTGDDGFYFCPFFAPVNEVTHEYMMVFNVTVQVSFAWNPDKPVASKFIQVKSVDTYVNFTGVMIAGSMELVGHYLGESDFAFVERMLKKALPGQAYPAFLKRCVQTVANVAEQAKLSVEKVLHFVLAHRMQELSSDLLAYANSHSNSRVVYTLDPVTPEVYYGLLRQGVFGAVDENLFASELLSFRRKGKAQPAERLPVEQITKLQRSVQVPTQVQESTSYVLKTADPLEADSPEAAAIKSSILELYDVLVATPDNVLRNAIEEALERVLVSQEVELAKEGVLFGLSLLKQSRVLTRKLEENSFRLDELLGLLCNEQILDSGQFLQIAQFYLQSSCELNETFINKIVKKLRLSESQAAQTRILFQTSLTVRTNLSLLEKAWRKLVPHFAGRIVKLSNQVWVSLGAKPSDLDDIKVQLPVRWPKEYFIFHLNGLLSSAPVEVKDAVGVLLECMFEDDPAKRFDLYDTRQPDEYSYTASNGKVFDRDSVRAVQRVRRISADYHVAAALLNTNQDNASTIFFRGEGALVDTLLSMNVPKAKTAAKETFKRVEYIYAQVLAYYMNLRDSVDRTGKEGNDSPELRNLFGTLDSYAVEEEMTLLGPPAYLADLLRFLGQMRAQGGKTALDILFSRRPDIGEIKLNAANANDPIPYIDLVCYALEEYIRGKMGITVDKKKFDTVAKLRSAVGNEVHSRLENSDAPRLKPFFSLPQTTNRAYFGFLGAPRYRLMELMGASPIEVAGEYFGMSVKERNAFANYYDKGQRTLLEKTYGSGGMLVTDLMKGLDMTYPELMELMGFFDFTIAPSSLSDYADISLQAVTNKRSSGNDRTFEEAMFLRRLHRMTGLPLKEFLKIVQHPLVGNNGYRQGSQIADLLTEICSFLRIRETLSLSFAETLELFGGDFRVGEEKMVSQTALARQVPDFEAVRVLFSGYPLNKASDVLRFLQKAKAVKDSEFNAKDLKYLTGSGAEDESYSLLAEETLESYADQVRTVMEGQAAEDSGVSDLHVLLSGWLGLGEDKLFYLTGREDVLAGLSNDPVTWCRHLHRIALCDQRLTLTSTQFKVLADHAGLLGTPDFFNPALTAWTVEQLLAMSRLVAFDYEFQPSDSGKSYMEALCSAENRNALLKRLSGLSGQNMTGYMQEKPLAYFQSPSCYESISEMMGYMVKLRCSAQELMQWSLPGDYAAEERLAQTLRDNISARYTEAKAAEWLRQTENPIREQKRDVLVAWLLEKDGSFPDTAGMTAYFLMDVEMNAEQDTSEIRHALSSVQMFVQRCLLNLETGITVSAKEREDGSSVNSWSQWAWMKNYRVWEANRKIFLFPENYLEPELRDGMSPFFQELLDELQQNEATQENVEDALLNYLHKLDQVAQLEVCGIYRQQDDLNPSAAGYELDVWHVVARTKSSPHTYFYRTYDVNYRKWSPWEKIEVDLDGEQVVPVVYNRRLYIFWLQFTQKEMKPEKLPAAQATSGSTEIQETLKYYEIQLLWTQRKGGTWLAKRISKQKLIHPWNRPTRSYTLKPFLNKSTNDLVMDIYLSTSKEFNADNKKLNFGLYPDNQALYTKTPYDETYSPWHSSAFVFDGDVKEVLFKDVSGSLEYVQRYFGPDGAAMKPLVYGGGRLALPLGMHLEGNWLKNNGTSKKNNRRLNIPEYTERSETVVTKTLAAGAKAPFEFMISLQNQELSATRKNALMFYKDNERIFSVHTLSSAMTADHLRTGTYAFETFYHPFVGGFIRQLQKDGLDGLYERGLQEKPWEYSPVRHDPDFFKKYKPSSAVTEKPVETVDFSNGSAFSVYNWELFFHIPFTIACRLMQNQKFEEAMNWFHYIFNPIDFAKGGGDSPERYWITRPFRENAREQVVVTYNQNGKGQSDDYRIEGILESLGKHADQVKAWRNNPFKPHIVAQYRTAAYQHQVVIKYINNLISWGDMLFREDTMESINEATMLYMLAGEILGARPNKVVNPLSRGDDHSFNELRSGLNSFGNAKTEGNLPLYIEDNLSVDDDTLLDSKSRGELQKLDISYFSTPSNDAMMACWDAVGDRLYKIRNSLNIDGVFRKLALYEPPIDPAMLVRAAAAGVSLKDALSGGGNTPRVYKFRTVIQKAAEFCQDVKALGDKLLSALEKKDSEALAQLRQSQELLVLNSATAVKKQQIAEAKEVIKQLNISKDGAVIRQNFFENIEYMSDKEIEALSLATSSSGKEQSAADMKVSASTMTVIPSIMTGVSGFGGSPVFDSRIFDGGMVANALNLVAQNLEVQAAMRNRKASIITTKAGYERRAADWKLQAQTAAKEVQSLERQIAGAEIRLAMAELDLKNHQLQIENNKAMTEAMNSRFATEKLYNWMANQVIGIYFKSYQMAYDLALNAQECFDFELGESGTQIIKSTHWNSLYKGLMAGDTLLVNIRELEKAYLERNVRSLELTKSVSLAELAPGELMRLISTGSCSVRIPNKVFNMDYPNHYLRRIKNVSISIPCIAGPYTSINCSLTLKNATYYLKDGTPRTFGGSAPSIATSSAQNDSGLFEVSFNDERFLPFEGMGVESEWTISLPIETNYFDRTSIADIILNISYTARNGESAVADNTPVPYGRLFNLKSEFPDEWYRFLHPAEEHPRSFEFLAEVGKDRLARYLRGVEMQSVSVWGKVGDKVSELSDAEVQYAQGRLKVRFQGSNAPAYDNLYVVLEP